MMGMQKIAAISRTPACRKCQEFKNAPTPDFAKGPPADALVALKALPDGRRLGACLTHFHSGLFQHSLESSTEYVTVVPDRRSKRKLVNPLVNSVCADRPTLRSFLDNGSRLAAPVPRQSRRCRNAWCTAAAEPQLAPETGSLVSRLAEAD